MKLANEKPWETSAYDKAVEVSMKYCFKKEDTGVDLTEGEEELLNALLEVIDLLEPDILSDE